MKALLILYSGCVYYEVATALSLFADYQVELTIASSQSQRIVTQEGLPIQANLSFKLAQKEYYDFVLIPGGDCESVMGNLDLIQLLQSLDLNKTMIGAICNGALMLAQSGLLDGKTCTHTACPKYADPEEFKELLSVATPIFEKTIYLDQNVVVEQNIVTAKPWAQIEFALTLGSLGNLMSEEQQTKMLTYYRGQIGD